MIGIPNPINISVLSDFNLISGQPIISVISNNQILAIYLIKNDGELFQTYGKNDQLFLLKSIDDLTLLNIQKYNLIKYFITNCLIILSFNEFNIHKKELTELENKIFYNLLHTEIDLNNLKKYLIREIKKLDFKYELKQKLISRLTKLKLPNKKLLNKKIDLNLSGYGIYINTRIQ